jgi:hypothetical protein
MHLDVSACSLTYQDELCLSCYHLARLLHQGFCNPRPLQYWFVELVCAATNLLDDRLPEGHGQEERRGSVDSHWEQFANKRLIRHGEWSPNNITFRGEMSGTDTWVFEFVIVARGHP